MIRLIEHEKIQSLLLKISESNDLIEFRSLIISLSAIIKIEFEQIFDSNIEQSVIIPISPIGIFMIDDYFNMKCQNKIGCLTFDSQNRIVDKLSVIPYEGQSGPVIIFTYAIVDFEQMTSAVSRLQLEGFDKIFIVSIIADSEVLESLITEFINIDIFVIDIDNLSNKNQLYSGSLNRLFAFGERYFELNYTLAKSKF